MRTTEFPEENVQRCSSGPTHKFSFILLSLQGSCCVAIELAREERRRYEDMCNKINFIVAWSQAYAYLHSETSWLPHLWKLVSSRKAVVARRKKAYRLERKMSMWFSVLLHLRQMRRHANNHVSGFLYESRHSIIISIGLRKVLSTSATQFLLLICYWRFGGSGRRSPTI